MGKEIVIQVQEAWTVLGRTDLRRNTPRHILIVIKLTEIKDTDRTLKATRENDK